MKVVKIILGILWAVIIGFLLYIFGTLFVQIINIKPLYNYNKEFVSSYLKERQDEYGDEIVSSEKYVYELYFLSSGTVDVDDDDVKKSYYDSVQMKLKGTDFTYEILFSHSPYEKIEVEFDGRETLLNNMKSFDDNFLFFKNVIQDMGYEVNILNKFNDVDNSYGDRNVYFLLIYVPNIKEAYEIDRALYKQVYGGYVSERRERFEYGDVDMPRYIFVTDKDLYEKMKENIPEVTEYLFKYSYNPEREENEDRVTLNKIVKMLAGDSLNELSFRVHDAQLYEAVDDLTYLPKIFTYENADNHYYLDTYTSIF